MSIYVKMNEFSKMPAFTNLSNQETIKGTQDSFLFTFSFMWEQLHAVRSMILFVNNNT